LELSSQLKTPPSAVSAELADQIRYCLRVEESFERYTAQLRNAREEYRQSTADLTEAFNRAYADNRDLRVRLERTSCAHELAEVERLNAELDAQDDEIERLQTLYADQIAEKDRILADLRARGPTGGGWLDERGRPDGEPAHDVKIMRRPPPVSLAKIESLQAEPPAPLPVIQEERPRPTLLRRSTASDVPSMQQPQSTAPSQPQAPKPLQAPPSGSTWDESRRDRKGGPGKKKEDQSYERYRPAYPTTEERVGQTVAKMRTGGFGFLL
jgi:hypothetical protein